MKTLVTVAWAVTVSVDIDSEKANDEVYLDKVRNEATSLAGDSVNWKDGIITDCENFPQLVE